MEVLRDPQVPVGAPHGTALTIGAYDGIHLGHRALLRHLRHLADERHLATAIVTFDRHPAQLVRPESAPKLLTDLEQKIGIVERTGLVDYLCILTFDERRRHEKAEDFVREVLVEKLRVRLVVVGADFHFGYQRRGNVAMLGEMGEELGFDVLALDLVTMEGGSGGVAYSSTLIRGLLMAGDVTGAARLLGRPHEVRGTVVQGDQRGRELGFPTANVTVPPETALPAEGIYAGWLVAADGVERPAAISLGRRPTFYADGRPQLEAYVLDFDGDLYGQAVLVRFVARLRDEMRFESVDQLVAQMHRDVAATRQLLG